MKTLTITFLLMLSVIFCIGCGGVSDAPETVKVTGTVTFDGAPVNEASIIFEDSEGKEKSFFAKTDNGAFSTQMTAGKKKVIITAIREIPGKTVPDAAGTGTVPATEQYIPKQYNKATTLEKEIKAEGPNKLTFDLKSKQQ